MKWSLCFGAVLAAAVMFAGAHGAGSSAAAAMPTPAALQYDEVARAIVPPASPPAPDSFQTAYQSLASATPKPQPHGLFGFAQRAINAVQGITQGHLTRYTYYRGWVRTDDPAAQTATIEKCAGGTIHLDLAKKTYTVDRPATPCPHGETGDESSQPEPQESAAPGTVDLTITSNATALGPLTIDGIGTTGSRRQLELNMSNATGSCHNGDAKMQSTEYVSKISLPRRYCPLPKMKIPTTFSMATGSRGGCTPRVHGRMEGSGLAFDSELGNRLALYVLSQFGGSSGSDAPAGLMMAIQRGNVHWLSGPTAEALFAVPPGFTQAGS